MDRIGKLYLALLILFILIAVVVAAYTFIINYIRNRKADKRKIVFKRERGRTKGYWKTNDGEEFDSELKLENDE